MNPLTFRKGHSVYLLALPYTLKFLPSLRVGFRRLLTTRSRQSILLKLAFGCYKSPKTLKVLNKIWIVFQHLHWHKPWRATMATKQPHRHSVMPVSLYEEMEWFCTTSFKTPWWWISSKEMTSTVYPLWHVSTKRGGLRIVQSASIVVRRNRRMNPTDVSVFELPLRHEEESVSWNTQLYYLSLGY